MQSLQIRNKKLETLKSQILSLNESIKICLGIESHLGMLLIGA